MGYTTDFGGRFNLDKPLTKEHQHYLERFSCTRRVKRNPLLLSDVPDRFRVAVGLPLGNQGEYFVGEGDRDDETGVLDYSAPAGKVGFRTGPEIDVLGPADPQPGLWCQWIPTKDGQGIEWDEGEKFYDYVAWIEYLIKHFLKPWGYVVNGEVFWQGEDPDDRGKIVVEDNVVTTKIAVITYQ